MPSIMNRAPNDVSPTPISVHPYSNQLMYEEVS